MRVSAALFAICVAGCLASCTLSFPDPGQAPYPCDQASDCADGFVCIAQVCQPAGAEVVDAGDAADSGAGLDVGSDDATAGGPDSGLDAGPEDSGGGEMDGGMSDAGCVLTQCGADCVDLQTSVQHCGQCQRDCQVGSCAFGQCQPQVVHQQSGAQPTLVVLEASRGQVYWTDQRIGGAIMGRDAALEEPTYVVQSRVRYATALAATADYVAWSAVAELSGARRGSVLYKAWPFTAEPVIAASDQSNPRGLTIAAGHVYWNSDSPLYIRGHALGQAVPNLELRSAVGSSYARALVANETDVFWADSQADIYAQTLNLASTPAPRLIVDSVQGEASDLVLHDGTLYWAEDGTALAGQGRIFSAPISTGIITEVVAQADPADAEQSATGLAFYQGYLYYTTATRARRSGSLFRVPHTGGTPERLVQGNSTDEFRDVAVGNDRIFWTQDDAVYVLAVP